MAALYQIHNFKDEPVGQLWLKTDERRSLQHQGRLQLYVDPMPLVSSAPMDVDEAFTITTCMLILDRNRQGEWRIYTDAKAETLKEAREGQEKKFRFPVPILLFPG
jgi:hypothetical protein